MIPLLERLERGVALVERWAAIALLAFMVTLGFVQIVLRTLFHSGFPWADELLRQLVLWVGFLGASLATRYSKGHISIDLVGRFLSPEATRRVGRFGDVLGAVVCAWLAWASVGFVRANVGERAAGLPLPIWVLQSVLPFAFGAIAVRLFLKAVTGRSAESRPLGLHPS